MSAAPATAALTRPEPLRRLNWGCGRTPRPGWINSDLVSGPGIDLSGDIRDGLPLETDSIDYAASIHALVEIPYTDLVPTLEELRRVLKPHGTLRLALPDLERAVAAFARGDHGYFLVPDEHARSIGGKFVTQLMWYGQIRTPMTYDFLDEWLGKAGFARVRRCSFRETASRHPGIVDLDDRERESLFVEATK